MADWKKLLVENPPASDIASSPSSGKVLKVSSNGTGVEWADDAGGAFSDNGTLASVTDRIVTITGSSSAIPTLDINPPSGVSGTSYSRIRVQTSGRDLRFNLRNGSSTSDVMTIGHDGKVGIGTNSPAMKLHVVGGDETTAKFEDSTGKSVLIDGNSFIASNEAYIKVGNNQALYFQDGSNTNMTITGSGKVGIGTSAPNSSLHINESSATTSLIRFTNSGASTGGQFGFTGLDAYVWNNEGNGKVILGTNSTARMTITHDAKIGIGTSSPSATLEIYKNTTSNNDKLFRVYNANGLLWDLQGDGSLSGYTGNSITNIGGITGAWQTSIEVGGGHASSEGASGHVIFKTNNAEKARLTNTGNFGIGTNSPQKKLHVSQTGTGDLARFESTGESFSIQFMADDSGTPVNYQMTHTGNKFVHYNAGNIVHASLKTGEVGIGTASPTAKLQVEPNNSDLTSEAALGLYIKGNNAGIKMNRHDGGGYTHLYTDIASNDFLYVKNNGANDGGIATDRIASITVNPANNYIHFDGYNKVFSRLGTQQMKHDQYGVTISDDLVIPTDASGVSHKIKITGDSTHEIYSNSYQLRYDANTGHQWNSSGGNSFTGGAGTLQIDHSTGGKYIRPAFTGFNMQVSHDGKFGFVTVGSTHTFNAIQSNYTDNNTWDLILNSRASGSDTERVRIKSDGKVGIGTNNPYAPLHLLTTNSTTLRLQNTGGALNYIQMDNSAGTNYIQGNATSIGLASNGDVRLIVNNNIRMKVDNLSRISLANNDSGTDNTIFGMEAGKVVASGGNYNTLIGRSAGISLTTGDQNTFLGTYTGGALTTGTENTSLGYYADGHNQTGIQNTAVGNCALLGASGNSHSTNTAVGHKSLFAVTTGSNNVAVGAFAGDSIISGERNSLFGTSAGTGLQLGRYNSAFGYQSLHTDQHGSYSTALGFKALYSQLHGTVNGDTGNVGVGYNAGFFNVTGINNTYIGSGSGLGSSGASNSNNTGVGYRSLFSITSAGNNLSIGVESSKSLTIGSDNVALGHKALYSEDVGSRAVAIGSHSLYSQNMTTDYTITNIGIGYYAGYHNVTGVQNTSIGYQAMQGASGQSNSDNTAVGYNSMYSVTTGGDNTAVGHSSLYSNTTGADNTGVGMNALYSNVDGIRNSAFGDGALKNNTTGSRNTGLGRLAGLYNQTGSFNVAIGESSMHGSSGNSHSNNIAIGYQSLYGVTTGSNSVAIGHQAGYSVTNSQITAIGYQAGYSLTGSIYYSVFVGQQAGKYISSNFNVAVGDLAMGGGDTTASNNGTSGVTAIGYKAYGGNTSSSNDIDGHSAVAVGAEALQNITSANYNTAVGAYALSATTTGAENIAIGTNSGKGNTTGYNNTYVGHAVASHSSSNGHSNTFVGSAVASGGAMTGNDNVGMGRNALLALTSGVRNVALGHSALSALTSGQENMAMGKSALLAITTGSQNVAIGQSAMSSANGSESYNIAIGHQSMNLVNDDSADHNIALGYHALQNTSRANSIGIGKEALKALTTGNNNLAIGYEAGKAITTVNDNTLVGFQSGKNVTGAGNSAFGMYSLYNNTSGGHNTAVGSQAAQKITTAHNNVAVGHASGYGVTTGNDNINIGLYTSFYQQEGANNVAIGSRALQGSANFNTSGNIAIGSNALIKLEGETGQVGVGHSAFAEMTTGAKNTGVGFEVGKAITTGYDNTLLGYQAGLNMTQADSNVLIGRETGDTIVLGRRNTIVGDQSDVSANGAINQIVLGAEATGIGDNTAIIGNSAVTDVYMGDNGSSWSTTSDGRLKENIEEWSTGLDAINKLRIVEYNFKEDNPYNYDHKKKRQGIIAQEAIEAIPEMIKDDGEWLSANQEPMIWALVNAVKELTSKVNMLESKLNKEN